MVTRRVIKKETHTEWQKHWLKQNFTNWISNFFELLIIKNRTRCDFQLCFKPCFFAIVSSIFFVCVLFFLCMNATPLCLEVGILSECMMESWIDSNVASILLTESWMSFMSCEKRDDFFKEWTKKFFLKAYVYRILRWISHRAPIYGLFPARDCLVQLACLCSRFEWGHLSLLETRRGHRYRLQDLRSQWIVRQWQPKVVLSIHRTKKKD